MNWSLVEPPRIKREVDVITQHILDGIERAERCAKWLKAQGYTVLSVSVGRRNPLIEIQSCRLCQKLEGAVYMIERNNQGVKRGWVALRHECQVRWAENLGGAL